MENCELLRLARYRRRQIMLENRRAKRHKPNFPLADSLLKNFTNTVLRNTFVNDTNSTSSHKTNENTFFPLSSNVSSPLTLHIEGNTEPSTSTQNAVTTNPEQIQKQLSKSFEPWNFGPPKETCPSCGAILWYEERTLKSKTPQQAKYSLCCQEGKVKLPLLINAPNLLQSLLRYDGGRRSSTFRENIRTYNSMFAFTSIGGNVDRTINSKRGPYIFRINGSNHHKIGSLLPMPGGTPKFAQLYIYDTDNEVSNRINAIGGDTIASRLDVNVITELMKMLHENNVLADAFRMARDRFNANDVAPIRLRLLSSRPRDSSIYNLPTTSEVAALIVGDLNDTNCKRDIIVDHKSNGLQRICELHPSFMAMQYPLLFPYGEDGYHKEIKYSEVEGKKQTSRKKVTMREFYAYRIQQRTNEGKILLCSGKLFQQYLVDAYTCIEQDRLRWISMNQPQLRAELYKGIKDAVLRGDTTPASVGKRIVLPSSFTGGPRYMAQNFQDAMAICKWYGNPDFFLTFTASPNWPEVKAMLNLIPGQKPEDRPDVVTRVFKIKLDQLLKDLVQGQHFGRAQAGKYCH